MAKAVIGSLEHNGENDYTLSIYPKGREADHALAQTGALFSEGGKDGRNLRHL